MRILIVKLSAFGDIIHALPVLDYLRQTVPDAEVDWVVEEAFAPLLEGNQNIDELIVIRAKSWRKHPFASETRHQIMAVIRQMRKRNYDMVFDVQGNIKSGITTWLSTCSERIGFTRNITQEAANTWFTTRQIPVRPTDTHVTDQYLRIISTPFNREFNSLMLKTDIAVPESDTVWVTNFMAAFGHNRVFLFHCGTTWKTKFWHEAGWVELATLALKTFPGCTVLLTWGNETERLAAQLIADKVDGNVRVVERLPLGKLIGLLKKVDLAIGGDTGIIHAAAAVGTATVSFYRASDAQRSGPRGKRHRTIQTQMSCSRCFRTSCDKDALCRESIKANELLTAMQEVLAQNSATAT